MSSFDPAFPVILKHEGGYVNDPNDPGGATKYGISLYWLKSLSPEDPLFAEVNHDGRIDITAIKNLTVDEAKALYQEKWWDFYKFGNINDQAVATKTVDTAVNIGGIPGIRILQKAAISLGKQIVADGRLGVLTFAAINCCDPVALLSNFRSQQLAYYTLLVNQKPQFSKFFNGWKARAEE